MSTRDARPTTAAPRRTPVSRRIGYSVAVVVNAVLLILVNGTPGWRALPFVTDSAAEVVVLLNLALIVGIVANSANLIFDRRWIRAAGELTGSAVSLAMLMRMWEVFPFAFRDPAVDWDLIVRVVIAFSIAACAVSIVVQAVVLIRLAVGSQQSDHPASARPS